ncbi:MAG: hypothetical protein V4474_03370 [Patescibacteria group bacterium]
MKIHRAQLPEGLYERVLARVAHARQRAARVQFSLLAAVSCLLTLLFVPALQYAAQELYASGFYEYISLAFSDGSLVLGSREFVLSLVESLPSLAVLLVVAIAVPLGWSLWRAARAGKSAFLTYA